MAETRALMLHKPLPNADAAATQLPWHVAAHLHGAEAQGAGKHADPELAAHRLGGRQAAPQCRQPVTKIPQRISYLRVGRHTAKKRRALCPSNCLAYARPCIALDGLERPSCSKPGPARLQAWRHQRRWPGIPQRPGRTLAWA